jgi:secreted repeat protein with Y-X4-D motif
MASTRSNAESRRAAQAAPTDTSKQLTSHGTPRAGDGVNNSLLRLSRVHNGMSQVTYGGHPLYTFVGDKRAGQTTGQGLNNFGAGWYVLGANGQKIDRSTSAASSSGSSSSGGYSTGGGY